MHINPSMLKPKKIHELTVSSITPRPIAWISTRSANNVDNIAPYSFFTVASINPLVLCVTQTNPRADSVKTEKDTLVNLMETKECVIHIVNEQLVEQMNQTCAELPASDSEFEFAKIETCPSYCVKPLSVKNALIRYECQLRDIIEISNLPAGGKMMLLNVQNIYINDKLYIDDKINQAKLNSIGKMGGNFYNTTKDLFEIERATV